MASLLLPRFVVTTLLLHAVLLVHPATGLLVPLIQRRHIVGACTGSCEGVVSVLPPLQLSSMTKNFLISDSNISHLDIIDGTTATVPVLLPDTPIYAYAQQQHCKATQKVKYCGVHSLSFLAQLDILTKIQEAAMQVVLGCLNNHHVVGSYDWAGGAARGGLQWKFKQAYIDWKFNNGTHFKWANHLLKGGDMVELLLLALFSQQSLKGDDHPTIRTIPDKEAAIIQNQLAFGMSSKDQPSGSDLKVVNSDKSILSRIALGGGCHWCTEGVFVSLCGVAHVEQGWVSSLPPHDAFSEAVIVHYDPAVVSPEDLVAVHLETHAATKNHTLRHRYRSAVYFFASSEADSFHQILNDLARDFPEPILTQALPFVAFRSSLPEHQDYYRKDPNKPFCQRFIAPKLAALRKNRPSLLSSAMSGDE